jgi:hypothetical protein
VPPIQEPWTIEAILELDKQVHLEAETGAFFLVGEASFG